MRISDWSSDVCSSDLSAGISAVAVGSAYDADGDHSIRLNEYVNASGLASSAFGSMARARANYATALGSLSHATGLNSTAVGGGWDDLTGDGVVDRNAITAAPGDNAIGRETCMERRCKY